MKMKELKQYLKNRYKEEQEYTTWLYEHKDRYTDLEFETLYSFACGKLGMIKAIGRELGIELDNK